MDSVIDAFAERRLGLGPPEISTGLRALDRAIIGLRPGRVMVLAGRPSMGKSALADSIRRAVVGQGHAALQFSLEMGADEILERELAFRSQMNLRKVMCAKEVTDEECGRVMAIKGTVTKGLWSVYDTCFSMVEIQRKARVAAKRLRSEGTRLGLVVIDYLQLIGDVGTEGRQQSVSACSRITKLMSKELGCTVLVLSQLNRSCEYRDDKRPLMSDLRESGAIEQDADIVAFVYREHVYNQAVSPEDCELILRKQRSGPIGTIRLRFNPKFVSFEDAPPVVQQMENLQ
ncbi:DnaB helicase C-terminal domain-containing protein [Acidithiobacillus sp.]|uniref:DnaB helicase C-terminal domain-containing protein n=1 Tax=Acidithiobacillus sp. TaxID=1872118 RepID=UPI00258B6680|nr:DnaB helicase C-terminal domain-containing protein [Acidithiobacillus sp.]MDD5374456.1 DnaB helicase C-terminal domain-containing protein [Acidithiobacillus sp.]